MLPSSRWGFQDDRRQEGDLNCNLNREWASEASKLESDNGIALDASMRSLQGTSVFQHGSLGLRETPTGFVLAVAKNTSTNGAEQDDCLMLLNEERQLLPQQPTDISSNVIGLPQHGVKTRLLADIDGERSQILGSKSTATTPGKETITNNNNNNNNNAGVGKRARWQKSEGINIVVGGVQSQIKRKERGDEGERSSDYHYNTYNPGDHDDPTTMEGDEQDGEYGDVARLETGRSRQPMTHGGQDVTSTTSQSSKQSQGCQYHTSIHVNPDHMSMNPHQQQSNLQSRLGQYQYQYQYQSDGGTRDDSSRPLFTFSYYNDPTMSETDREKYKARVCGSDPFCEVVRWRNKYVSLKRQALDRLGRQRERVMELNGKVQGLQRELEEIKVAHANEMDKEKAFRKEMEMVWEIERQAWYRRMETGGGKEIRGNGEVRQGLPGDERDEKKYEVSSSSFSLASSTYSTLSTNTRLNSNHDNDDYSRRMCVQGDNRNTATDHVLHREDSYRRDDSYSREEGGSKAGRLLLGMVNEDEIENRPRYICTNGSNRVTVSVNATGDICWWRTQLEKHSALPSIEPVSSRCELLRLPSVPQPPLLDEVCQQQSSLHQGKDDMSIHPTGMSSSSSSSSSSSHTSSHASPSYPPYVSSTTLPISDVSSYYTHGSIEPIVQPKVPTSTSSVRNICSESAPTSQHSSECSSPTNSLLDWARGRMCATEATVERKALVGEKRKEGMEGDDQVEGEGEGEGEDEGYEDGFTYTRMSWQQGDEPDQERIGGDNNNNDFHYSWQRENGEWGGARDSADVSNDGYDYNAPRLHVVDDSESESTNDDDDDDDDYDHDDNNNDGDSSSENGSQVEAWNLSKPSIRDIIGDIDEDIWTERHHPCYRSCPRLASWVPWSMGERRERGNGESSSEDQNVEASVCSRPNGSSNETKRRYRRQDYDYWSEVLGECQQDEANERRGGIHIEGDEYLSRNISSKKWPREGSVGDWYASDAEDNVDEFGVGRAKTQLEEDRKGKVTTGEGYDNVKEEDKGPRDVEEEGNCDGDDDDDDADEDLSVTQLFHHLLKKSKLLGEGNSNKKQEGETQQDKCHRHGDEACKSGESQAIKDEGTCDKARDSATTTTTAKNPTQSQLTVPFLASAPLRQQNSPLTQRQASCPHSRSPPPPRLHQYLSPYRQSSHVASPPPKSPAPPLHQPPHQHRRCQSLDTGNGHTTGEYRSNSEHGRRSQERERDDDLSHVWDISKWQWSSSSTGGGSLSVGSHMGQRVAQITMDGNQLEGKWLSQDKIDKQVSSPSTPHVEVAQVSMTHTTTSGTSGSSGSKTSGGKGRYRIHSTKSENYRRWGGVIEEDEEEDEDGADERNWGGWSCESNGRERDRECASDLGDRYVYTGSCVEDTQSSSCSAAGSGVVGNTGILPTDRTGRVKRKRGLATGLVSRGQGIRQDWDEPSTRRPFMGGTERKGRGEGLVERAGCGEYQEVEGGLPYGGDPGRPQILGKVSISYEQEAIVDDSESPVKKGEFMVLPMSPLVKTEDVRRAEERRREQQSKQERSNVAEREDAKVDGLLEEEMAEVNGWREDDVHEGDDDEIVEREDQETQGTSGVSGSDESEVIVRVREGIYVTAVVPKGGGRHTRTTSPRATIENKASLQTLPPSTGSQMPTPSWPGISTSTHLPTLNEVDVQLTTDIVKEPSNDTARESGNVGSQAGDMGKKGRGPDDDDDDDDDNDEGSMRLREGDYGDDGSCPCLRPDAPKLPYRCIHTRRTDLMVDNGDGGAEVKEEDEDKGDKGDKEGTRSNSMGESNTYFTWLDPLSNFSSRYGPNSNSKDTEAGENSNNTNNNNNNNNNNNEEIVEADIAIEMRTLCRGDEMLISELRLTDPEEGSCSTTGGDEHTVRSAHPQQGWSLGLACTGDHEADTRLAKVDAVAIKLSTLSRTSSMTSSTSNRPRPATPPPSSTSSTPLEFSCIEAFTSPMPDLPESLIGPLPPPSPSPSKLFPVPSGDLQQPTATAPVGLSSGSETKECHAAEAVACSSLQCTTTDSHEAALPLVEISLSSTPLITQPTEAMSSVEAAPDCSSPPESASFAASSPSSFVSVSLSALSLSHGKGLSTSAHVPSLPSPTPPPSAVTSSATSPPVCPATLISLPASLDNDNSFNRPSVSPTTIVNLPPSLLRPNDDGVLVDTSASNGHIHSLTLDGLRCGTSTTATTTPTPTPEVGEVVIRNPKSAPATQSIEPTGELGRVSLSVSRDMAEVSVTTTAEQRSGTDGKNDRSDSEGDEDFVVVNESEEEATGAGDDERKAEIANDRGSESMGTSSFQRLLAIVTQQSSSSSTSHSESAPKANANENKDSASSTSRGTNEEMSDSKGGRLSASLFSHTIWSALTDTGLFSRSSVVSTPPLTVSIHGDSLTEAPSKADQLPKEEGPAPSSRGPNAEHPDNL